MKTIVCIIHLFLKISLFKSDIYRSTLKLCYLLKNELDILSEFENRQLNEIRFLKIHSILQNIRKELPKSIFKQESYITEDCLDENSFISRFITNPINSYSLILRFVQKWPETYILISNLAPNLLNGKNYIKVPENELRGAREAIYRLGDFYALNPEFLSNGSISAELMDISAKWISVPQHLTPIEMLEIAKIGFDKEDYAGSKPWLLEALKQNKYPQSEENLSLKYQILDYLSLSEYLYILKDTILRNSKMLIYTANR